MIGLRQSEGIRRHGRLKRAAVLPSGMAAPERELPWRRHVGLREAFCAKAAKPAFLAAWRCCRRHWAIVTFPDQQKDSVRDVFRLKMRHRDNPNVPWLLLMPVCDEAPAGKPDRYPPAGGHVPWEAESHPSINPPGKSGTSVFSCPAAGSSLPRTDARPHPCVHRPSASHTEPRR